MRPDWLIQRWGFTVTFETWWPKWGWKFRAYRTAYGGHALLFGCGIITFRRDGRGG